MRAVWTTIFRQAFIGMLIAAFVGIAVNISRPDRIAWVERWDRYIETQAYEYGVALAGLNVVSNAVRDVTHIIFDARPVEDYDLGHIPGAMSWPYDELEAHASLYMSVLSASQPVLTYCSGVECDDALLLSRYLMEQGITNIALFADGWTGWQKGGRNEEH